jgi:hypothetical protein
MADAEDSAFRPALVAQALAGVALPELAARDRAVPVVLLLHLDVHRLTSRVHEVDGVAVLVLARRPDHLRLGPGLVQVDGHAVVLALDELELEVAVEVVDARVVVTDELQAKTRTQAVAVDGLVARRRQLAVVAQQVLGIPLDHVRGPFRVLDELDGARGLLARQRVAVADAVPRGPGRVRVGVRHGEGVVALALDGHEVVLTAVVAVAVLRRAPVFVVADVVLGLPFAGRLGLLRVAVAVAVLVVVPGDGRARTAVAVVAVVAVLDLVVAAVVAEHHHAGALVAESVVVLVDVAGDLLRGLDDGDEDDLVGVRSQHSVTARQGQHDRDHGFSPVVHLMCGRSVDRFDPSGSTVYRPVLSGNAVTGLLKIAQNRRFVKPFW